MHVMFFGNDRHYAEGLCIVLEDIYKKKYQLSFFNFFEASFLLEKLNNNIYDIFVFDTTSYTENEMRSIERITATQCQRRVHIIDHGINNKNSLSQELWSGQEAICKTWPVSRVRKKLVQFKMDVDNGIAIRNGDGRESNEIRRNEMEIIILLSNGIKVKNIAKKLNVRDKTIYYQISVIKRKLGVERKNQFLNFLSSINS